MSGEEKILLHDVEGIARKSGVDQHGCRWMEFTVDYGALEEDGECSICGKTISAGWLCLDGGDEMCAKHVELPDDGEAIQW